MDKIYIQHFRSIFGDLIIGSFKEKLCLCDWRYRNMHEAIDKRIQEELGAEYVEKETEIIRLVKKQLREYFKGDRKVFDIPLLPVGTEFQKRVWKQLLTIPYGSTESYLGLSQKLGDAKAIRAVAAANGANAISIIIPCHRIVGSAGELTGYAGGVDTKRKLLQLESGGTYLGQLTLFDM